MNKLLLLKLHRWISLVFALPLLVIIVTGLILSFEPVTQVAAVKPGGIDAARVVALVKQYDPDGKARGLSINPAVQHITLLGRPGTEIDLASGAVTDRPALAGTFQWARMTHEHLIGNAVATIVIARWENALDTTRLTQVLDGDAVDAPDGPHSAAGERGDSAASSPRRRRDQAE